MSDFASFLLPNNDNEEIDYKNNRKPNFMLECLNFNEPETPVSIFSSLKPELLDETMRIFLRLRPFVEDQLTKIDNYRIIDDLDILAIPPEDSASYRNFIHGYGKTSQKFTFSKLFPESTNQISIFDGTTKSLIYDFLKGNDRLLFTYGTTSSGKTFTMSGNKKNVGIIPRSLISLFNNVNLSNNSSIMPIDFSEIITLKNDENQKLLKDKSILLKVSEKESSEVLKTVRNSNIDLNDDSISIIKDNDNQYECTFWVSFTEIYNEMIYDLLDVKQCQIGGMKAKRPILDIRTARSGGAYVKGLSCYPVFSAEEAYRLFLVGRRNQKTSATKLNQNSSRSHTIFTIRSVRTCKGSKYLTRVSNFSFCDLAGSERTDKAQTTGISQKESSNINSSLLTLGRCIEVLKRNQSNPGNLSVVPFRDSKLTRLFQTYLSGGQGKAAMIVCVNPDPKLFDETVQVLKFSALARKVVIQEKEKIEVAVCQKLRKSHFSRLGLNTPRRTNQLSWGENEDEEDEQMDTVMDDGDDGEEYTQEQLIEVIEALKSELLASKKENYEIKTRVTEELNSYWSRTICKMESEHAIRLEEVRDELNNNMLKQIKVVKHNAYREIKKRKIQFDEDDNGNDEIVSLRSKLLVKEEEINELVQRCKDVEEENLESKETAEISLQKLEKLELVYRQQEFCMAAQRNELNKLKSVIKTDAGVQTTDCFDMSQDISDASILTIEASDISIKSNSSRFNRFSSLSSDPKLKNSVFKFMKPENGYFGPLSSPQTPPTVKKANIFEIHENDFEDNEIDDFEDEEDESFIQHELENDLKYGQGRDSVISESIICNGDILKESGNINKAEEDFGVKRSEKLRNESSSRKAKK